MTSGAPTASPHQPLPPGARGPPTPPPTPHAGRTVNQIVYAPECGPSTVDRRRRRHNTAANSGVAASGSSGTSHVSGTATPAC